MYLLEGSILILNLRRDVLSFPFQNLDHVNFSGFTNPGPANCCSRQTHL
jgi:hypothetical protein